MAVAADAAVPPPAPVASIVVVVAGDTFGLVVLCGLHDN